MDWGIRTSATVRPERASNLRLSTLYRLNHFRKGNRVSSIHLTFRGNGVLQHSATRFDQFAVKSAGFIKPKRVESNQPIDHGENNPCHFPGMRFSDASIFLAPRNGLLDEIEKISEELFEVSSTHGVHFSQFVEIVPMEKKESIFHGCSKTKIKRNDPFQHLQPVLELGLAFIIFEFLEDRKSVV